MNAWKAEALPADVDLCFLHELGNLSQVERKQPVWVTVSRAKTDPQPGKPPEVWEQLGHVEEGKRAVIEKNLELFDPISGPPPASREQFPIVLKEGPIPHSTP